MTDKDFSTGITEKMYIEQLKYKHELLKLYEKKLDIYQEYMSKIYNTDEGNSFFLAEEAIAKILEIK